jgi:hypothetical protein
MEPPVAPQCAVSKCSVEGQICSPGSKGSISLGYICCGVTGGATHPSGNWCPDMSVPCGPRPRAPGAGKPLKNYGTACANTSSSAQPGVVTTKSHMALDFFVLEREGASG